MNQFTKTEVEEAIDRYIGYQQNAAQTNDWNSWADEIFTPDALYICEYGPLTTVAARGIDEIKATHLGGDMEGWEGWTFPYIFRLVDGDKAMTQWMNRGPGKRADGSYFETPGVSWLTYAGNGKFSYQFDMFDIAHQVKLCDELYECGLLSEALKVKMQALKQQLIDTLQQGV